MYRVIIIGLLVGMNFCVVGQRYMEDIGRGVVAVRQDEKKVFVSWRLLINDPDDVAFNIYRVTDGKSIKLNTKPVADVTFFVDETADLSRKNEWVVRAVVDKKEQAAGKSFSMAANIAIGQYLSVPLKTPEGYTPNDGSVGDLDGDGEYELVIHMTGKAHDNSHKGITDEPILHAYKLDGTLLWSINLGKNIREGAH